MVWKNALGWVTKRMQFAYDAFDRRIAKRWDWDVNGTLETQDRYVYDGEDVAMFFDESGTLKRRYLHGPGVDMVLVEEQASTGDRHWMLGDDIGSVRDVVGDDGTVLNHIVYNAFGQVINETDWDLSPRYGFAGRELDIDADLYFNRARYYDANTGRFISQDPIGFGGGDDNLYRYVGNAPTMFTDPDGLMTLSRQPESYGLAHPTVQQEYRPGLGLVTTRHEAGGPKIVEIDASWRPRPQSAPQSPAASPAPLPGGGGSGGGGEAGGSLGGGGSAPSPLKTSGRGGGGGGGSGSGSGNPARTPAPSGSGWWIIDLLKAWPQAYWDTMKSGEQFDSMAGYTDTLQQKLLLGYKPLPLDQFVDHWDAYKDGAGVGDVAGNAMNAIMTVAGVRTMITGIQAIRGAGGLVQIGKLTLSNGQVIPVIVANGEAIPATVQTLQAAGLTAAGALNVLNQTQNPNGGSNSGSSTSQSAGQLTDGMRLKTDQALAEAEKFLGPGYKDLGNGRFVSADGARQVRMGDGDILGRHGGGPHMNFETLRPNPAKPGKMEIIDNKHIYLDP